MKGNRKNRGVIVLEQLEGRQMFAVTLLAPLPPAPVLPAGGGAQYADAGNVGGASAGARLAPLAVATPAAPKNLRVTSSDLTSVSLAFDAPIVNGVVYRVAESSDGVNFNHIGDTPGTTYTATGLTPGTKLWFEVRAANGTVYSNYSNVVSTTVPAPVAPANLRVTSADLTSVSLAFDAPVVNGVVYRVAESSDGVNFNHIGDTAGTTYTATGLTPGANVFFEVRAAFGTVYSNYSNILDTTVPAPVPPANLRITSADFTSVSLAFDAPAVNGVVYRVAESSDGVNFNHIGDTSGNTFTATGLTPGTKVFFEVRAAFGTVYSNYSNVVSTTLAIPTPAAPTNLRITASDATSVSVAFDAPIVNGVVYRVAESTDGVNFNHIGDTAGTTYTATGLTPGTTVFFEVRAANGTVYSNYSNIVSTTLVIPAPSAPKNLRVSSSDATSVSLEFDAPITSGVNYHVSESFDGEDFVEIGVTSDTTYKATNLAPGTKVWFEVRAAHGTVYSNYSNVVSKTVVLAMPTALKASVNYNGPLLSPGEVVLTWTNGDRNATINIVRSTDGVHFQSIAAVGPGVTTYTDTSGLQSGTKYYYEIRSMVTTMGRSYFSAYTSSVSATPQWYVLRV
jgi:sulfur transfer protein SufE